LPSRSQSQSDLTSNGAESQVYSGPITRSKAKTLTYAEVQSSVTTFDRGQNQSEEQYEVTSPAFYDLRTLFQEESSKKRSYQLSSHKS